VKVVSWTLVEESNSSPPRGEVMSAPLV